MTEKKKVRKDLTLKEKLALLESYDKLPKMGQRNAAVQLKISQPLLCKILKNRGEILKGASQNDNIHSKRNRPGKDEQVGSALRLWFTNVRENDARVDGPLMKQKAEELATKMGKENFFATDGWFSRWKKRENIVYKRTHGEQKDADVLAAETWLKEQWPKIIAEYSPENIYNADETGLYYRGLPEHTFLFKNESAKGCKTSKDRLTVMCCVSMSGTKENLLVIGKSKNPRCFKGVKQLPVDYCANSNAWMTSLIFNEWLQKWDNKLKHNIVLLIDNCTAHVVNVSLKHIRVIFLPANTTSLIQPCDQGIIRALKAYYRREMRARILESLEDTHKMTANDLARKTDILQALHLLSMSWKNVSSKTIRNCFSHGGFSSEEKETEELIEKPSDLTQEVFEDWMSIDENVQVAARLTDTDICQIVSQTDQESSEENEGEDGDEIVSSEKPPSASEMRQALKIIRLGVQYRSEEFNKLYEFDNFVNNLLRKTTKQQTLHNFF
jgi:hypothetical protein